MEIYSTGLTNQSHWSWREIEKMKKKMQKSYNLADSIKKVSFYIKKREQSRAEKSLEKKLQNL